MRELRESDIEKHLINRVVQLGGEVRKVKWVGRKSAPDRLVMMPPAPAGSVRTEMLLGLETRWRRLASRETTIWVELKAPGKAATFPADAHERAQHREHERMRAVGQFVVVIDSIEGVEELLA